MYTSVRESYVDLYRAEEAGGLPVREMGTFDLSEQHSADAVGGCVNVCHYG
jgi:hypothetical protein